MSTQEAHPAKGAGMRGVYAIAFDFPERTLYAGVTRHHALGWAPTLLSALLFEDADSARRTIENGYGETGKWARVVTVERKGPA